MEKIVDSMKLQWCGRGIVLHCGLWVELVARTLAMIKPDAIQHTGKILECITSSGFIVKNMRMCELNITQAETFYQCHKGKPFFS
jgi:hypothetical protein